MSGISRLLLLLALFSLTSAEDYLDCLKNYSVLEQAVLETGDNRFNIIRAFYSPNSTSPSFYVKVNYVSAANNEISDTWLWTKAPIYFIEPPSIFQFTSLFFNHHHLSKQTYYLEITLPSACCNVSAVPPCLKKDNSTEANAQHVNNKYLGVLTNELYLYAQYNGKNSRIVLEDVPSISQPYNTQCSTIDEQSIYLYYILCLVLPFLLLFLASVIFQSCRPHIRKLLKQPSQGKNFNQNFSAVLLTGLVFSVYVVTCDVLASVYAFKHDRLGMLDHYVSKKAANCSKYTIVTITVINSFATLYSFINLVVVSCMSFWEDDMTWNCIHRCLCLFTHTILCSCNKYERGHSGKAPPTFYNESKLWLLLASFAGPVVCIGTHSSFVIMAWSSDSSQASSMIIVFVLSFLYYFIGFRQLYVMLILCPCKLICCSKTSVSNTDSHRPLKQVEQPLNNSSPQQLNSVVSDNHRTSRNPGQSHVDSGLRDASQTMPENDTESNTETQWSCKPRCSYCTTSFTNFNDNIDSDLKEHHKTLEVFNFRILLLELLLIPVLMGVEALIIITYTLLPAPVTEVPVNILNMLQLTLIIGGALITYKLFQFETPIEQTLLQSFVKSYGGNNDSNQFVEVAGQILAEALKEMKNNSKQFSPPEGETSQVGDTLTTSAEIHDSTS